MNKAKILSALMAFAIVATPGINFKSNNTEKASSYQISANAADKITGWVQKNGHMYYYDAKGNMVKNQWKKIDGNKYCFDKNGRMLEGTWKDGKFLFPDSGVMVTGCAPTGKKLDKWCNFDSNGNSIESGGGAFLLSCNQNIYSSTSTNSKIKGKLKKGELVYYSSACLDDSKSLTWIRINYKGNIQGWIIQYNGSNELGTHNKKKCLNAAITKFSVPFRLEGTIHNDRGNGKFVEVNYRF